MPFSDAREPEEHLPDHWRSVHGRELALIYGSKSRDIDKEEEIEKAQATDLPGKFRKHYDSLVARGFSPFFDYYGAVLGNPTGGVEQTTKYAHEIIAGFELDLQAIAGWQSTKIVASAGNGYGEQLSDFIPNTIEVNEAYITENIALFNLYIEKDFFDDDLDIRVGRFAAGQVFATLPAMWIQVNGGINPNPNGLYENINFTTSSGSTWAGYVDWQISKDHYLSAGIFQAGPDVGEQGSHGVNLGIGNDDGILTLYEAGWQPGISEKDPDRLIGYYVAGAYYQHLETTDYAGGTVDDLYGFYLMAQQMLWRDHANPSKSFSIWGGLTWAPKTDVVANPIYGFAGTIWQGLVPKREKDKWLCSVYVGNYGDNFRQQSISNGLGDPTVETVLETSYLIQITKNISVQPDLQYIFRPQGTGQIDNALVLGLQVIMQF